MGERGVLRGYRRSGALILAIGAVAAAGLAEAQQGQGRDPFAADKKIEEYGEYNDHTLFDWAWGELEFQRSYPSTLQVKNDCSYEQILVIDVGSGVDPYLTIPERTTVPPGESTIDITITTPAALLAPPTPPPGAISPPPPFEIFVDIKGKLMLEQEQTRYAQEECLGGIKIYNITGHIHYFPPDPDEGDPCAAFWMSNRVSPPGQECTEQYRGFAAHHIESLQGAIDADPGDWTWLPSGPELVQMSEQQLIDMKLRMTAQRAGQR